MGLDRPVQLLAEEARVSPAFGRPVLHARVLLTGGTGDRQDVGAHADLVTRSNVGSGNLLS